MKVRPRLILEAERIETEGQARQATVFPNDTITLGPKGWAGFIGDWLVTGPHGKFIAPAETFSETYELV